MTTKKGGILGSHVPRDCCFSGKKRKTKPWKKTIKKLGIHCFTFFCWKRFRVCFWWISKFVSSKSKEGGIVLGVDLRNNSDNDGDGCELHEMRNFSKQNKQKRKLADAAAKLEMKELEY